MPNDLRLGIRLTADGKGFVGEVRVADKELGRLTGSTQRGATANRKYAAASKKAERANRGLASGFKTAHGRILRYVAGLASATLAAQQLASVVRTGLELEAVEQRFRVATDSAAAAAKELAFFRAEAERLGLSIQALERPYSGFLAALKGTTLEGEPARKIFTSVAGAARVMGASADDTRGIFLALEQIISKGNVSAEELRGQLGERLPGAFQIAARAIGVTTAELDKMLRDGELLAEDLLPKFAEELNKTFGDELTTAVNSAAASFARLENAIRDLKVAAAESGLLEFVSAAAGKATLAARLIGNNALSEYDEFNKELLKVRGAIDRYDKGQLRGIALGAAGGIDELEKRERQLTNRLNFLRTGTGGGNDIATGVSGLQNQSLLSRPQSLNRTPDYAEEITEKANERLKNEQRLAAKTARGQEKARRERVDAEKKAQDVINKYQFNNFEEASRRLSEKQDAEKKSIERIKRAALELKSPYEQAVAAAEAFRSTSLDTLDQSAADYKKWAGVVQDVYQRQIADAQKEAADAQKKLIEQQLADSNHLIDGVTLGLMRFQENSKSVAESISDAMNRGIQSMSQGLADFITTGEADFKGFASSIINEIARIYIEQQLLAATSGGGILSSLFNGLGGLFGGGGGIGANSFGFNSANFLPGAAAYLHDGGIAGRDGLFKTVSPAVFLNAPRFHAGGLAGDEVPAILQRGEEVLPGNHPRHQNNAGGVSNVTVNQVFDFRNADETTVPRLRAEAGRIKEQTKSEILDYLGNTRRGRALIAGAS